MERAAVDAVISVHDEHAFGGFFRGALQSVAESLPGPPAFRVG
jgi:hypothetical protein